MKTCISLTSGFCFLFFLFSSADILQAQDITTISESPADTLPIHKNAVNIIGSTMLLGYGIGISYERILLRTKRKSDSVAIRARYSYIEFYGSELSIFNPQLVLLGGKKKHYLECSIGYLIMLNGIDYNGFSGNVGYKFKDPVKPIIFRTGIGWPEGIYVGLGLGF